MPPTGFIDPAGLDRSLAALPDGSGEGDLMATLEQVMAVTRELFDATGCGLMLLDDSSVLAAVAATDEPGRLMEVRQEKQGHGPCVDALTFDRTVTARDAPTDERWPGLRDLVEVGVHAVLGVPLHANHVPVGSLNVYRDRPHDWDETEVSALTRYAAVVEGVLQTALHARGREQLVEQLQHALDHRVVIERAVGMIMGRQNINAVDAFNQLRRRARSTQRVVADVAGEMLAEIPGNPD